MFRKFIINFLKLDNTNRILLNRLHGGKILIVDDVTTSGTTFSEINRIINTYMPEQIVYYTLFA